MMSRAPLLSDSIAKDMMRGIFDIARSCQQISRRHEAHELRNQESPSFDVVVNTHVSIPSRFSGNRINDVLRQAEEFIPNHSPLPLGASFGLDTLEPLRGNAKSSKPDGIISHHVRENSGTDLRFVNCVLNAERNTVDSPVNFDHSPEQPHRHSDDDHNRSAGQHSLSNSVQVIGGGQL